MNIAGQADFSGNRIIAPVSINSGSLNLTAPGTVLTGDLNVASGAGIDMRLANSVVPTTPYLTVNGAANFAQASKVTLSANPGDFTAVPSGTEYTLLQASSVQNNGLSVASTSSLLDLLSYSADRLSGQRDNREAVGVWLQGLSSNMDQDGRGGDNGYSANSSGMAVGVDGRLNDSTTVGVAYSYLNSNIHSDLGTKTDVQGHALSLYGNWSLQNWFVDGSLSYGHNDNDSKRRVAGTTAKGSYDSNVLSASVLGGYSFKLSDAAVIEPRVAARYSNVRMDSFTEKGSSAALSTGSQRYEVGELGAGVRLAGNFPLATGSLQPEATLMAYHDLMGDRVAQTSSFVLGGSAFTVTGASVARDSYEASLGLNYQVSALTVGASYTRQARSGFDADGVMVKARYAF